MWHKKHHMSRRSPHTYYIYNVNKIRKSLQSQMIQSSRPLLLQPNACIAALSPLFAYPVSSVIRSRVAVSPSNYIQLDLTVPVVRTPVLLFMFCFFYFHFIFGFGTSIAHVCLCVDNQRNVHHIIHCQIDKHLVFVRAATVSYGPYDWCWQASHSQVNGTDAHAAKTKTTIRNSYTNVGVG